MDLGSRFLILSLSLFLMFTFSIPHCYSSDKDETRLIIFEAEEVLSVVYKAALEAELDGVDVSGLLGEMNLAGEYLAEANLRYRIGAYGDAFDFANLSIETLDDLHSEIVELSDNAERMRVIDFTTRIFWSAVGVVVVGIAGFLAWRVFKRRYLKRVLKVNSEVVSSES
jgi:hypothetical protein